MHSDYNIENILQTDFYKKCQKHVKIEFTIFFAQIVRKSTFELLYLHVRAFYIPSDIFYSIKRCQGIN